MLTWTGRTEEKSALFVHLCIIYVHNSIPRSSWNEVAMLHVPETARRISSVCEMVLHLNKNIHITLIS
jgi:hypothetical protein